MGKGALLYGFLHSRYGKGALLYGFLQSRYNKGALLYCISQSKYRNEKLLNCFFEEYNYKLVKVKYLFNAFADTLGLFHNMFWNDKSYALSSYSSPDTIY